MRMGQGVRTGLGHEGITCVLQTQFSSFFLLPVSVNVWKCDEEFVFFCIYWLRVLLLFQNKWTNIRRGEQTILNKYNKSG